MPGNVTNSKVFWITVSYLVYKKYNGHNCNKTNMAAHWYQGTKAHPEYNIFAISVILIFNDM